MIQGRFRSITGLRAREGSLGMVSLCWLMKPRLSIINPPGWRHFKLPGFIPCAAAVAHNPLPRRPAAVHKQVLTGCLLARLHSLIKVKNYQMLGSISIP